MVKVLIDGKENTELELVSALSGYVNGESFSTINLRTKKPKQEFVSVPKEIQFCEFDTKHSSKALTFEVIVESANTFAFHIDMGEQCGWARDFLDALACLGEEKVKELIKGVGGE